MTISEYKQIPGWDKLPLVNDYDKTNCEKVDTPDGLIHRELFEAINLPDALFYLHDKEWVFRGGVIFRTDSGEEFVYAYFWKKRTTLPSGLTSQ